MPVVDVSEESDPGATAQAWMAANVARPMDLTRGRDVVFGTTLSGRPPEIAGVETLAGFSSTLPVWVRWDPAEALLQMLARVPDHPDVMTRPQHVSLTDIHQLTGLGDLFDTATVLENYPTSPQTAASDCGPLVNGHDAWHYPLRDRGARAKLVLYLWYQPDPLDHTTARQIACVWRDWRRRWRRISHSQWATSMATGQRSPSHRQQELEFLQQPGEVG